MINFALIGVAGYIAPRHLEAIKSTGNNLIVATDPHDSVGIIDKYFRDVSYFREFERFDRHIEKLRRKGTPIDYVSICSPNYLHDAHCRFGLRVGANVICEKPLVIKPWNCDALQEIEQEYNRKINTILQLRLHPSIIDLKNRYANTQEEHNINLKYITSRGSWYLNSWKGNIEQSGGLLMNIGIHFFDMLLWIFGKALYYEVYYQDPTTMEGFLVLEHANVNWCLSIDYNRLPEECKKSGKTTYRSITIDGKEIEFSEGFTDLHVRSYEEILAGRGFGISDVKPSIELVHGITKESKK